MLSKKVIIIVSVIIFIAFFLLIINYFLSKKNSSENTQNITDKKNEEQHEFPIDESGIKNQETNPESEKQMKSSFDAYVKKDSSSIEWKDIADQNKNFNLDGFLNSTGTKINPSLKNILNPTKFTVFSCSKESGKKDLGIIFELKLLPYYNGDLASDREKFMREWEPSMLKDLSKIIFPGVIFSESDLAQNLNWKNGKYRYTEIELPDKSKSSINYELIDDYIPIASSSDCLFQMSNALFETSN